MNQDVLIVGAGLIWFVQVVHYPLFASVGSQEFPSYEQRHTALTTWVVAPPMLIEGATAVLLIWFRPTSVAPWSLWTGLALLGVSWLSACFSIHSGETGSFSRRRLRGG